MSGRLQDKVAIVTGGASGIGRASVRRFLSEGARVVVADLNETTLKETVAEAQDAGHGERVQSLRLDVTSEADVEAAVALAVSAFGRLDVMFNNAGFGGAVGPIEHVERAHWDETLAVLLTGVFLGTKHAVRVMKGQPEGGSIINTSSVAGISGGKGPQAYTAAKHAVIGLTRATSVELAEHLIRVNAICPGGINTPLLNGGDEQAAGQVMDALQPWPEHGKGDHIADAALFLASDESRFVTGHHLVVDGGLTVGSRPKELPSRFAGFAGISRGSTGQEGEFTPLP